MTAHVAVIGGGVLGTLVALGLERTGITVDLIDDRAEIWSGATGAAEGKAHLGYVYAKASDDTIGLLVESAHRFAQDVEAAVGIAVPWTSMRSAPFEYVVAEDSQISPALFEEHVDRIHRIVAELGPGRSYLGSSVPLRVERLGRDERGDVFRTDERAVDIVRLQDLVARRLESGGVQSHLGTEVRAARLDGDRWTLDGSRGEMGPYEAVVNCAWDRRVGIDRDVGLDAEHPPALRLRAFVHGVSDGPGRAQTVVLGPYGDFVRFDGGRTYASWYPTGLLGFHVGDRPPTDWPAEPNDDVAASMLDGLSRFVPEVHGVRERRVLARVVVAHGATDIDDPDSDLHQRDDAGVMERDGWFSIRSPKLTTAPMLASTATTRVLDSLR